MWYHPAIVNLLSTDHMLLAIISPLEVSIRVITNGGLILEWLGKAFRAFVPIHARGLRILSTTWVVNHGFFDQFIDLRLFLLIWKLSRDE